MHYGDRVQALHGYRCVLWVFKSASFKQALEWLSEAVCVKMLFLLIFAASFSQGVCPICAPTIPFRPVLLPKTIRNPVSKDFVERLTDGVSPSKSKWLRTSGQASHVHLFDSVEPYTLTPVVHYWNAWVLQGQSESRHGDREQGKSSGG